MSAVIGLWFHYAGAEESAAEAQSVPGNDDQHAAAFPRHVLLRRVPILRRPQGKIKRFMWRFTSVQGMNFPSCVGDVSLLHVRRRRRDPGFAGRTYGSVAVTDLPPPGGSSATAVLVDCGSVPNHHHHRLESISSSTRT